MPVRISKSHNSYISDIQLLTKIQLDDPIYLVKIKEVLGHKWTEVLGGVIVGLVMAAVVYFLK
jgi:uncharacterized protein